MWRLLLLLPLVAACVDYDKLGKGFCETATHSIDGVSSPVTLCDDFEADNKSPAWNKLASGGGAVDPTDPNASSNPDSAFRGRRSLRLTVPAGAQAMLEETSATSSLASGDIFYRSFVYFTDATSSGRMELLSLRDSLGMPIASMSFENAEIAIESAGRRAGLALALTGDKWFCLEMVVSRDRESSPSVPRIELFVDDDGFGTSRASPPSAQLGDVTLAPYAATRVGIDRSGVIDAAATEVWMDEVIVDSRRIGCAK